jgi:hypothetical protein
MFEIDVPMEMFRLELNGAKTVKDKFAINILLALLSGKLNEGGND